MASQNQPKTITRHISVFFIRGVTFASHKDSDVYQEGDNIKEICSFHDEDDESEADEETIAEYRYTSDDDASDEHGENTKYDGDDEAELDEE